MKIFLGGMIHKEFSGDLFAAVSAHPKDKRYGVFLYGIKDHEGKDSEEYIYLSGVGVVQQNIVELYCNINHETGTRIIRQINDQEIDPKKLRSIELWLVHSPFADHQADHSVKPVEQIVLTLDPRTGKYGLKQS